MRRRATIIALLLLALVFAACGDDTGSDTTAADTTTTASDEMTTTAGGSMEASVSMVDITFEPAEMTIEVGTTVTWTNDDTVAHTVTALDGSFLSGTLDPGGSFSHTFETTGTFDYRCEIHPTQMTGTIEVVEG